MENLARYIIRASFSQERMTYLPEPVVSLKVERVINKILLHLGLWPTKQCPPPKSKTLELQIDYSDSRHTFYEEAPDPDFEIFEDHPLD